MNEFVALAPSRSRDLAITQAQPQAQPQAQAQAPLGLFAEAVREAAVPAHRARRARHEALFRGGQTRGVRWMSLWNRKDAWWAHALINSTFAVLAGITIAETAVSVSLYRRHKTLHGMETKLISNGVVSANVFLWPILWDITIRYEGVVRQPRMLFGFLWPMLMSTFDMRYIMDKRPGHENDLEKMSNGLNADAQAIISAAFAMGALMSSLKSVRGTHIIMYALILSLSLVIPHVATPAESPDRVIILNAQKAALNNAIGFIVAGIAADFLNGGASKEVFAKV